MFNKRIVFAVVVVVAALLSIVAQDIRQNGYLNLANAEELTPTPCPCTNCANYAQLMRPDIFNLVLGAGEAKNWPQRMIDNGHPELVKTVPKVGVLVVFSPGVQGAPASGHVAHVTHVHENGNFDIREYGWYECGCPHPRENLPNGPGVQFLYGSNDMQPTPTPVPALPRLVLTSDIQLVPNPVVEGQPIGFQIPVQNVGGQNLNLHNVTVRVQTATGGIWEAGGDFDDIPAGGTANIVIGAPVWDHYGTWRILEVVYQHGDNVWGTLDANSHFVFKYTSGNSY